MRARTPVQGVYASLIHSSLKSIWNLEQGISTNILQERKKGEATIGIGFNHKSIDSLYAPFRVFVAPSSCYYGFSHPISPSYLTSELRPKHYGQRKVYHERSK